MSKNLVLSDICHVYGKDEYYSSDLTPEDRRFVGMRILNNKPSVWFPIGYRLSIDDKGKRKDILSLLNVLRRTLRENNRTTISNLNGNNDQYSLLSYQRIILDFLANGYYKERERSYLQNRAGKISWGRTIKKIKPIIQDENIIFLNFMTRRNIINEDAILTQIHKYCVYKSFLLLGWLYTDFMPDKPEAMSPNITYYKAVIKKKINVTFNDSVRVLLNAMYSVLNDETLLFSNENGITIGTYRFEYPWQLMIDTIFSHYDTKHPDKKSFFPSSFWIIGDENPVANSDLIPDTVMIKDDKVYILDAKYYKYGIDSKINNLPQTDSVQKQITYGDYAFNTNGYQNVYNAFLLPYAATDESYVKNFGYAYSNWRESDDKTYKIIYGVYLDVKWLMQRYLKNDISIQKLLSEEIDKMVDLRD
jgi:hypothetical protein